MQLQTIFVFKFLNIYHLNILNEIGRTGKLGVQNSDCHEAVIIPNPKPEKIKTLAQISDR